MQLAFHKLQEGDISEVLSLIERVTHESYVFEKRNMDEYEKVLKEEMIMQKERLKESLNNTLPHILMAKEDDQIIGTIGIHSISKSVKEGLQKLDYEPNSIVEIVLLYVDPRYQKRGIGTLLYNAILLTLQFSSYHYFAISTAFDKGIAFWTKTLGKARIVLQNYYEDSVDCYVWIKKVEDTHPLFKTE